MIVGIIGSRRRNSDKDFGKLVARLSQLERETEREIEKIVTGDCDEGGDKFAREIADMFGYEKDVKRIRDPYTNEPMDFKNHRWFDYYIMTGIFYKRDEEIAKEPMDYLLALVAPNRIGGTEKTINYFKRHNKNWYEKLIII